MKFTVLGSLIAFVLALAGSHTFAATDGQVGTTSRGQIVIRLVINQGIQVSNLQDIELLVDNSSVGKDLVARQRFCIRGNTNSQYTLVAEGEFAGGEPFALRSRNNDALAYQLYFTGNLASNVLDPLAPGVPSRAFETQKSGVNCDGQNNAEIMLVIPSANLKQANGNDYSGFLNLTVAIE